MNPAKRWIVTGCNGYLGGQLCRGLHNDGQSVIGLSRPNRNVDSLKRLSVKCRVYEDLPGILKAGDVLVHCAGKTGNTGRWEDFEAVNVAWSVELFALAAKHRIDCFIYVSSVAALGYKNRPERETLDESDEPDLCEGELYGRSKLLAEQQLTKLAEKSDTRLIILRPGLIYGRRPLRRYQSWLRRGCVVDPEERVPLVHIDNFQDAVVKVARTPDTSGTFLVVDNEQPTRRELIDLQIRANILKRRPWRIGRAGFVLLHNSKSLLRRLIGRKVLIQPGYLKAALRFHCRRNLYSTKALRDATGWAPKISLVQGLESSDGETK